MEILSENSSGNNNVFAEGETINKGIDDYERDTDTSEDLSSEKLMELLLPDGSFPGSNSNKANFFIAYSNNALSAFQNKWHFRRDYFLLLCELASIGDDLSYGRINVPRLSQRVTDDGHGGLGRTLRVDFP